MRRILHDEMEKEFRDNPDDPRNIISVTMGFAGDPAPLPTRQELLPLVGMIHQNMPDAEPGKIIARALRLWRECGDTERKLKRWQDVRRQHLHRAPLPVDKSSWWGMLKLRHQTWDNDKQNAFSLTPFKACELAMITLKDTAKRLEHVKECIKQTPPEVIEKQYLQPWQVMVEKKSDYPATIYLLENFGRLFDEYWKPIQRKNKAEIAEKTRLAVDRLLADFEDRYARKNIAALRSSNKIRSHPAKDH